MSLSLTFGSREKARLVQVLLVGAAVLGYCLMFSRCFVLNCTRSLSEGLYVRTNDSYTRGVIVAFFPESTPNILEAVERNYIEKGISLLKKLEGMPGDRIRVTEDGVYVNGQLLKNSRRAVSMKTAYALPHEEILGPDEYFVMTENPHSYDSRYFGKVSGRLFTSTVKPFLVWE